MSARTGANFPVWLSHPQSGLELMRNPMIRRQEDYRYKNDVYYVGSAGKPVLSTTDEVANVLPTYQEGNRHPYSKRRYYPRAPTTWPRVSTT